MAVDAGSVADAVAADVVVGPHTWKLHRVEPRPVTGSIPMHSSDGSAVGNGSAGLVIGAAVVGVDEESGGGDEGVEPVVVEVDELAGTVLVEDVVDEDDGGVVDVVVVDGHDPSFAPGCERRYS